LAHARVVRRGVVLVLGAGRLHGSTSPGDC
jgi:hypothetical protein